MIPIHSRIIIIVFFYCRINKHFMIDMYNVFIVFMDTAMGLSGFTIREKKQKESHFVTRKIQLLKIGTLHTPKHKFHIIQNTK